MATTAADTDAFNDFDVQLLEEPDESELGAVPKFEIIGADTGRLGLSELNNALILDADIGSKSHILQCRIAHVCHGTLEPNGDPATLLVMLFVFQPKGQTKRFKQVEVTLNFMPGSEDTVAPEVLRMSPVGEYALFPSEQEVEISHVFSPSLEATVGLAKGTLGYQLEHKTSRKIKDHGTIFGVARGSREVFWGLYENESTDSGIPSMFQGAILLKREKKLNSQYGQQFSLKLTISGRVNRKAEAEEISKNMFGTKRRGEDVLFDPKAGSSGRSIVKDPARLEDEDIEGFKKLVTIREWRDGTGQEAGVRVEQNGAQVEASPPSDLDAAKPSVIMIAQVTETTKLAAGTTPSVVAVGSAIAVSEEPVPVVTDAGARPLDHQLPTSKDMAGEPPQVPQPQHQADHLGTSASSSPASHRLQQLRHEVTLAVDQRLEDLRGELSRVRIEANLVRRLIMLEREEARIIRDITELEVQRSQG